MQDLIRPPQRIFQRDIISVFIISVFYTITELLTLYSHYVTISTCFKDFPPQKLDVLLKILKKHHFFQRRR